jgi:hypothetical protein
MFGITQGVTADTYEPAGNIPRWQMALFLHRMFVPMGVAAAGATAVPAFTDTSGLSAEIQAAITALASHGITLGTTATTFGPNDNVTREQMALFLYRLGAITKPYNSAVVTVRGIWHDTYASDVATGLYNYSDVNSLQLESLEAIASLYNAGVTGETCLADGTVINPTGGCAATYRPADAMTRAEMASMVTAILGHTNARPAGVTMQSLESLATAGAKNIRISVRNADFTPSQNTSIDHFYDPTQLTTSAALAANASFTAVLNTVSASVTSAVGTAGTVDSLDIKSNTLGNANGTSQSPSANSTTKWWAWTAPAGTIFVNGSTTGVATLESVVGAASTTVYADTTTYSISGSNALGQALVEDYSGVVGVTADDGIKTYAGGSRTLNATMSNSTLTSAGTAHTVVDGYTFKFAHRKVDMLGNITITNTYVPSSAGVASYVVTCGADNSLTVNADGTGSSSYYESHEVTVTEGVAAGTGQGISRPALAATASTATTAYPTDGGNNSTLNVSCDDEVRAYTAGTTGNTLSISGNTFVASTAGSLVSVTSTAYDQYGDGIAGVTSRIDKLQTSPTTAGSAVQQAILTSTANGSATLSMVVCNASFNGSQGFAVNTTGATMSNIAITEAERSGALDAGAGANGEGTTVYCAAAGTDAASSPGAITGVQEQQTITLSAAFDAGDFTVTYTDAAGTAATTAAFAGNGANTLMATRLNDLTNLSGVTAALAGTVYTITFAANTGDHAIMTATGTNSGGVALTTSGGGAITLAVAETVKGVALVAQEFVDEDAVGNTILTATIVTTGTGADGAAQATTTYRQWTYDSTDVFMLRAADGEIATEVAGATEAQFETEMGSLTGASGDTPISITYRTSALGSQVSVFNLGS